MTAPKPATPLPFAVEAGDGCYTIRHAEGGRVTSLHYASGIRAQKECQRDDAAYIVHACNALPRMEAALRSFLNAFEGPSCCSAFDAQGRNAMPQLLKAAEEARAALAGSEPQDGQS
jgi:hypothetical protein